MKLCDIICPKIIVNDEMARVRTGKDAITVDYASLFVEVVNWWKLS